MQGARRRFRRPTLAVRSAEAGVHANWTCHRSCRLLTAWNEGTDEPESLYLSLRDRDYQTYGQNSVPGAKQKMNGLPVDVPSIVYQTTA
jgi:hypothetical protein